MPSTINLPESDTFVGETDLHLFNEGRHLQLYDRLGAHLARRGNEIGVHFAVWAPNADYVSVVGDFNEWRDDKTPLSALGASGLWCGFCPGVAQGAVYKYHIRSRHSGYRVNKADPCGTYHECPPRTASVVWQPAHAWGDHEWMARRATHVLHERPVAIYEVHLASWQQVPEEGGRLLSYRELAPRLVNHLRAHGFTHVELMPVMEHPFGGSWGYQVTGYFAPTSRHGIPDDFMFLVDYLHQHDIGVILDWVPAHFPSDEHGLGYFDGTHLYEHADRRQGFHPDWNSLIFNYGRAEVRSFLLSSAMCWLDRYHADGLRVDGVASMLYLDYSRAEGEWIPNEYGGRENLEAISLLREMNEAAYRSFPGVQTFAEESTDWPMVSRPTYVGGLGFGFKWDMGWMHDTLAYLSREPVHRKYHHNQLTFRGLYAFNESFVMPLSHDEVVHGKGSLLGKMPGDDWQRFANLRLLLAYMWGQPGKKLLFMGSEFAQSREWNNEASLDWHLCQHDSHAGVLALVGHLNRLYAGESALHQLDTQPDGYRWIDANDAEQSVLLFERLSRSGESIVCAFNFTPVPRENYRIGVDHDAFYREVLNSDAAEYWGSGWGNLGGVRSVPVSWHGRPWSITVALPPLAAVWFKRS